MQIYRFNRKLSFPSKQRGVYSTQKTNFVIFCVCAPASASEEGAAAAAAVVSGGWFFEECQSLFGTRRFTWNINLCKEMRENFCFVGGVPLFSSLPSSFQFLSENRRLAV